MSEPAYFGLFGLSNVQPSGSGSTSSGTGGVRKEVAHVKKTKEEAVLNRNSCCICDWHEIKYTCPGCGFRTCSLACVNQHKITYECDGKRDQTPFVKISEFTEKQFLDDYTFLENANNAVDIAVRSRKKIVQSLYQLPKWLEKLRFEARLRGTRLKILPAGFAKRKANKSAFFYNEKAIRWNIEWIFHAAEKDGRDFKVLDDRISESIVLSDCVNRHINPSDVFEKFADRNKLLKYSDFNRISVLLKTDHEVFRIDASKTIREALVGKTIVEYPTFIVLLKADENKYKITEPSQAEKGVVKESQGDEKPQGDERPQGDEKPQEVPVGEVVQEMAKEELEPGQVDIN